MSFKEYLIAFWRNEDGFFGIGMGPTKAENTAAGELNSSSGFATGLGEKDLSASSDFMRGILSGDPAKISQVLAPQINSLKTSVANDTKTAEMIGDRSGGKTAATAASADKVHGDIADMVAKLTGTAATSLASTGDSLLGKGMAGNEASFTESQALHKEQMAKFNDLIDSIAATISGIAAMPGVSTGAARGLNAGAGMLG